MFIFIVTSQFYIGEMMTESGNAFVISLKGINAKNSEPLLGRGLHDKYSFRHAQKRNSQRKSA